MHLLRKLENNALTLCFSFFGIWVIWLSHRLDVPAGIELGFNLAFYPRLLGWSIFIISLAILLQQFLKAEFGDDKGTQAVQHFKNGVLLKRMGGSILLVTAYMSLISIVGYLLLTPIFLFAFISLLGNRNWIMIILVSLLLTSLVYFFFWILLYIPLPEGILMPQLNLGGLL
jgi:hypothetical protein